MASSDLSAQPSSKNYIGSRLLTLVAIYIALVGSTMQSATLSIMLPLAAVEIGGLDYYSLGSTFTGITSVILMPLWGYLGARNPNHKVALLGASLIIGGAAVLFRAFAGDMIVLVLPSLVYGVTSAGIFVIGYSLIRDLFDAKQAGTYLGICGTMMAIGLLIGPVFGGAIMDFLGWRSICFVISPIFIISGILVFFGAKLRIPLSDHGQSMSFDLSGTISMMVFLASIVLALSLGNSFLPFSSWGNWILWIIGIVSLLALIWIIAKKQGGAVIPAPALKNRNVLSFALANFFSMFSNMAIFFFLPMYIITIMGLSATDSGIASGLYSVLGLFISPFLGRYIGKARSARAVLSLGMIVRIVIALLFFFVLAPDTNIFLVYVAMFVAGFYSATGSTSFAAGPQIQIPDELRVQGNAVIQVGQNLGGTVGTAVYTVILAGFGIIDGMAISLIVSGITAGIALAASLSLKKLS